MMSHTNYTVMHNSLLLLPRMSTYVSAHPSEPSVRYTAHMHGPYFTRLHTKGISLTSYYAGVLHPMSAMHGHPFIITLVDPSKV